MKILHIITSLRTGGAERLVVELALRLKAAGDEVDVLLLDGTQTPLTEELARGGITIHALGKGAWAMQNPLLLPALRRFLRKHPYDIVHSHNTSCQFLTAMVPGITRFTTEHGTSNRRRSWRWFRPVDRWMYGRYRRIVCVSEETRQNLSAWLGRPELDARMVVIPNGIDLGRISSAQPAPELIQDPRYKILMVSAFRPEKDQMTLIRAMGLLPDDCLLLLAGGAELPAHKALLDACRQEAVALGLEDRVRFLGVRKDVPALLAASDLIVLSSRHEGLSLSVLEGMASGKPLLASDVEGIRDIVGGAGSLFSCGDVRALAETISQLRNNPYLAKIMAQRCRERAMAFGIEETMKKYRELYTNENQ
jgi:glycosyltransferase involved in cell wall biosynthesis